MNRRYWKSLRPTSLCAAIEACVNFARETHNLSVDRIAERMGMSSKFTLYKWMESGRLPAVEIPAFEHACGINYVTRYLGQAAHLLVFDMPTGRGGTREITDLQHACADAVNEISKFHQGKTSAEETLGRIQAALNHLAFHHVDIEKSRQPDLEFEK